MTRTRGEMGIEKLVTICPFCYSTFRRDYPDVGEKMNFEVVHVLPMVDQLIKDGKLKLTKPLNLTATYHDPFHLGRLSGPGSSGTDDFLGIYKEPRNIIKGLPGVNFVEMNRTKDVSWCCGGGSWWRYGNLENAQWTAEQRTKEAEITGADTLITYCPHCELMLGEAVENRAKGMKVSDLLGLVLQAL